MKYNKNKSAINFIIQKTEDNIKGVISFGSAEDYWIFVDQGVKGAGGFKGSGRMRGQGSDFRFGTGKGPKGGLRKAIPKWIKTKGIRGRDKKGRFITDKSLSFLIARSIYQRGLKRTRFITKPYEEMQRDFKEDLQNALVQDINETDNEVNEFKLGGK